VSQIHATNIGEVATGFGPDPLSSVWETESTSLAVAYFNEFSEPSSRLKTFVEQSVSSGSGRLQDVHDARINSIAQAALHRVTTPDVSTAVIKDRWEGVVEQVAKDHFVARLISLTEDAPPIVAEFDREILNPDDEELVVVGSRFYVNTGFVPTGSNRRRKVSAVRFRRLPPWRAEELQAAMARARKRLDALEFE
jgi:hypothetical protein